MTARPLRGKGWTDLQRETFTQCVYHSFSLIFVRSWLGSFVLFFFLALGHFFRLRARRQLSWAELSWKNYVRTYLSIMSWHIIGVSWLAGSWLLLFGGSVCRSRCCCCHPHSFPACVERVRSCHREVISKADGCNSIAPHLPAQLSAQI